MNFWVWRQMRMEYMPDVDYWAYLDDRRHNNLRWEAEWQEAYRNGEPPVVLTERRRVA